MINEELTNETRTTLRETLNEDRQNKTKRNK
jgi:hypothetical protein